MQNTTCSLCQLALQRAQLCRTVKSGRPQSAVMKRVLASFVRGGTSRAIVFQEKGLLAAGLDSLPQREKAFLQAMGSPDPDGRQIDGLGGGISSDSVESGHQHKQAIFVSLPRWP